MRERVSAPKGRFKRSKFCSKFPNFQNFGNRKEVFFESVKKKWKLLEVQKFGAVSFQVFEPFPNLYSTGTQAQHKGAVRRITSRTQQQRGSLDIGWAMADRKKRGAPFGLVPSFRPKQRSTPSSDREGMLQRMEAAAVIMLVLSTVVTSVVVYCLLPKPRQIIHEPRRLLWEEHTADINWRGLFRRMYRMDEHTFNNLAEMLRPILERNEY